MPRFGPRSIRLASTAHALLYRVSGGRLGLHLGPHAILLLITTGRVTGRPHRVPLLYLRDADDLVLIASFGGSRHHPDWYLNLMSHPRAEVRTGRERYPVVARRAEGGERTRLWERAVAEYPGYAVYQRRTRRLIPVVLLRRA